MHQTRSLVLEQPSQLLAVLDQRRVLLKFTLLENIRDWRLSNLRGRIDDIELGRDRWRTKGKEPAERLPRTVNVVHAPALALIGRKGAREEARTIAVLSKEFQFLNLVLKEALVGVIGWNDVVWVGV